MSSPGSKTERKAIFAQLFAGTVPAEQSTDSLAKQVRAYRSEILAYHAKGFSWAQIQEKLKQPPLNIDASIPTIVKSVSKKAKTKKSTIPLVALPPRSVPATAPAKK